MYVSRLFLSLLLPVDFLDYIEECPLRLGAAVRKGEQVLEDRVDVVDGSELLAEGDMLLSLAVECALHHLDEHIARLRIVEHEGGQVAFFVKYRHYGHRALLFIRFHIVRISYLADKFGIREKERPFLSRAGAPCGSAGREAASESLAGSCDIGGVSNRGNVR